MRTDVDGKSHASTCGVWKMQSLETGKSAVHLTNTEMNVLHLQGKSERDKWLMLDKTRRAFDEA